MVPSRLREVDYWGVGCAVLSATFRFWRFPRSSSMTGGRSLFSSVASGEPWWKGEEEWREVICLPAGRPGMREEQVVAKEHGTGRPSSLRLRAPDRRDRVSSLRVRAAPFAATAPGFPRAADKAFLRHPPGAISDISVAFLSCGMHETKVWVRPKILARSLTLQIRDNNVASFPFGSI